MIWNPVKSSAEAQGGVNGWKRCLRAQQPPCGDSNNMTVVIIHFKKASLSFFLQAVGQKSWPGWGDWAGNRRDPDWVWCGFLWLSPRSLGMSSPEPALGYLTGRAGQKKRFKVTTWSSVWYFSFGWRRVMLFCFAFIMLWKGADFITRTVLHVTCASMGNMLLKVPTNPEDEVLGEWFCEAKRLFVKRIIQNWKFGIWHLVWKLYVFVWNVLYILVVVL